MRGHDIFGKRTNTVATPALTDRFCSVVVKDHILSRQWIQEPRAIICHNVGPYNCMQVARLTIVVNMTGHVIAVRVTCEDADDGFKPTCGHIDELHFRTSPDVWGYFSVKSGGGIHEFSDSQVGNPLSSAPASAHSPDANYIDQ